MRITVRMSAGGSSRYVVVRDDDGGWRVAAAPDGAHALNLVEAFDDRGSVVQCGLCGCEELFVRKDFPQRVGLVLVVIAAVASFILFALGQMWPAFAVLGALVVADLILACLVGRCVVCYRCRAEYRDAPVNRRHRPWSLATGEKYRIGVDLPFDA